jgi:HlyD family secretion protein
MKKQDMIFKSGAIVAGVLSVVAVAVSAAESKKEDPAPKTGPQTTVAAKPALTVSLTQPSTSALATTLNANGTIAAWQEAVVGAEVNGLRLTDVRVNVGDVVKRGQVLATFSSETIAAEMAQQTAMIAEASAALADAQGNAARARSLQDSGAIPAQQIAQYLTAEKTAQARLDAARAAEKSLQLRQGFTRVIAPDDGVISARAATVGAVVGAGQELFRLIRKNRLEWRGELAASELAKVQPGQVVILTLPDNSAATGKVRIVGPTVDAQSRNGIVFVDLNASPKAKAGMYAKGEFAVGTGAALTVPQSALVLRDGFNYVMRFEGNNRVTQRKVQIGRRVGDRIEILEGVKPDEKIVASGGAFLADGDIVRVTP